MERRSKGLFFKCAQHYSPTHQCPDKQLQLLTWDSEEINDDSLLAVEGKEIEEEGNMARHFLDLRALVPGESFQSKTLKLEGLTGYPILLLVDSGASRNFGAKQLVGSLGLEVSETEEFKVNLDNGSRCTFQGLCKALGVKIGKYTVVIDAYVLDLEGIDLYPWN